MTRSTNHRSFPYLLTTSECSEQRFGHCQQMKTTNCASRRDFDTSFQFITSKPFKFKADLPRSKVHQIPFLSSLKPCRFTLRQHQLPVFAFPQWSTAKRTESNSLSGGILIDTSREITCQHSHIVITSTPLARESPLASTKR